MLTFGWARRRTTGLQFLLTLPSLLEQEVCFQDYHRADNPFHDLDQESNESSLMQLRERSANRFGVGKVSLIPEQK